MAQECGFFNAQLNGDAYDRVYLAEQFAAYFASFIGNGVFGKSMQELEVVAQDDPSMSLKVLSGQGWINGWWYRNTDEYNLDVPVADGVLSRIDIVVLRWGSAERAMYLQLIPGTPSAAPVKPALRRDADYWDLQLAQVSVPAGIFKITQAEITDTRLDNSVCGLVTGVVDQIDTTDLYSQFGSYFAQFKKKYEADLESWTALQKRLYDEYIENTQNSYDSWVSAKELDYDTWTSRQKQDYLDWVASKQGDYDAWVLARQQDFNLWYSQHTANWQAQFDAWFATIQSQLAGDIATQLANRIVETAQVADGYQAQETEFSIDGNTITQTRASGDKLVTVFVDKYHATQTWLDSNNSPLRAKDILFSQDGKSISETLASVGSGN